MHTIGSPGSVTNAMAVASVQNAGMVSFGTLALKNGPGVEYNANNVAPATMKEFSSLDTTPHGTGTDYEYVMVESYGEEGDFDGIDCEGKIVLVSRGKQINFSVKANNAAKAGAAGIIIYNNVSGTINMNLEEYTYPAPCVGITLDESKKFKSYGTAHTAPDGSTYYTGELRIRAGLSVVEGTNEYHVMSDFSSWGTTGDLALKPEITAPGGNIYSINGGGTATDRYVGMSGTSMSSPQVAGVGALVDQFIGDKGYEGEFANPSRGLSQSLMMSTAVPLKDSNGQYFSLIQQGAGMVHAASATSADSYIKMSSNATVSYDDGKVKAELGDDPERTGVYTFDFEIHNLDGEDHAYDLSADVFAQDHFEAQASADGTYTTEYMAKSTVPLGADTVFTVNGETVTSVPVPANGKAFVKVTISLTEEAKKDYLETYFQKGTYIQAFVFAEAQADSEGVYGTKHSIPVLAFYGSWTDPSMFWGTRSEKGQFAGNYSHKMITDDSRGLYYIVEYQPDADADLVEYYPENYFEVTAANGYSYKMGGNPLVADDVYMPERDAITAGTTMTGGAVHIMRCIAQYSFEIRSLDSGNVYYSETSASTNIGAYKNNYGYDVGYWILRAYGGALTDLVEGEQIEYSFTVLPEYYLKGEIGYGKTPGDGASVSISATVDSSLPQASDIWLDEENQSFRVAASDNQYIAAVVLYNAAGDKILSYEGSKAEIDPGEEAVYELPLENLDDQKYLIQVFDYALNSATYRVSVSESEMAQYGAMIAYNRDDAQWVIGGEDAKALTALKASDVTYNAATSINEKVFAVTDADELYVLTAPKLNDPQYVDTLEQHITDMAYNPADGYLYGVSDENDLVKIDVLTGQSSVVGDLPFVSNTLACDADGNFYSNRYGTGEVYRYTIDTVTTDSSLDYDFNGDGTVDLADSQILLDYVTGKAADISNSSAADIDKDNDIDTYDVYLLQQALPYVPELLAVAYTTESRYLQAMEIDPNSGTLYWASYFTDQMQDDVVAFSYFWSIDPEKGTIKRHYDYWDQLTSLVILDKDTSSHIPAVDKVARLNISRDQKKIAMGESTVIAAGVSPWNVEDPTILWSSSDESVATVDAKGNVTAVGNGTCQIIATSAMDENLTAVCEITVGKDGAEAEKRPVGEIASMANVDNSAKPAADEDDVTTFTLNIPAAEDLTNGLQTASIDTEDLTLLSISGADLLSFDQKESLLTIGYVHKDTVKAGENAVTLTFETKKCGDDRNVVLRELQRNNDHLKVQSVVELASHQWSEWAEVTAPACEKDGLKTRTCSACGETEEDVIPALEHSWSDWKEVTAATCIKDGLEKRTCGTCGESEEQGISSLGGHKWSEWKEVTAATCTKDGLEKRTCGACSESEEQTIPSLGGHVWGEWYESKAPTCVSEGELTRECAKCDAYETDSVSATGKHIWSEWEVVLAPTETAAGEEMRHCDTCDAKETNSIPATGHICPAKDYTDLDISQWYHEGVDFVLTNGYMNGLGNGLFGPDGDLTRAQLVTILYRIEGSPDVSELDNPFSDIPANTWYTDAVIWAESEGVVYGVGNGLFAPDNKITREQIATILYRYSGADPVAQDHIGGFSDVGKISGYAVDAMNWAVSEGLINGVGNNNLSPDTFATRAQIATILMRYLSV